MSAWSNKRTDRYGGDVHGRTAFPLEIIARTREKVGSDYPLIFRFSGEEHVPEGRGIDESRVVAQLMERAGIDAISVSAGTYDSGEWTSQPMLMPRGCLVPLAAEIKGVVGVPVVAVGRIHTPQLAEEVLRQGKADLIAMGRPLFADPDLPGKAREGRGRDIRHCISCNTCMLSLSSGPVTCLMNPELGHEGAPEVKALRPRRILVVNGGPAGIEAARVGALRGHQVKLWDEKPRLKCRWSWLLKPYLVNRLNTLAELGVEVALGKEITREAIAAAEPDVVVAGRGLKPPGLSFPGIDGVTAVYADDVLDGTADVAGRVVILGAGSAGFETADFLARRGHQVHVIEEGPTLGYGMEPLTRNVMRQRLVSRGVALHRRARISRIKRAAVEYVDEAGVSQQVPFDSLVLAHDWEPDETLVESLRGGGFRPIPVRPCQQPAQYVQVFREGSSIGRTL
jgi:NADPH-dependent 2,4-dienoyl-CoA reductase/sulfur reductase-like enzyme